MRFWLYGPACLVLLLCAIISRQVAAEERTPEWLSETGLYEKGQVGVVAADVRPFSPQYPLWTDGASKSRWVYLPPGSTIGATRDGWQVPIGTRFWKEFAFNGRKTETRMLWRASATRWVFATYQWDDSGTDARLAPETGVPNAMPVAPGKSHSIPSVTDCTACHGTQKPGPLGFNALQLSPDRDPNAIHGEPLADDMLTLTTLLNERRIVGTADPAPRIRTANPRTRAVLGYLMANCGTCHNGRGEIAALGPTLKYDELLRDGDAVARSLVGQPTKWQVPGVSEGHSVVIDSSSIDRSALLTRMRSRSPSSQMPPLGTVLRDTQAVDRIAAWVGTDLASTRSGDKSRN